METDKLNNLYELTRSCLFQTENINNEIQKLRYTELQNHLGEMLKTVQADLLIFTDFIAELTTCTDDADIDLLLSLNNEPETIEPFNWVN